MNWVTIEESPSHVAYDTTTYRNWYDDSDGDWYDERDDDWYNYSDEDEDWESESEWYEQLYKWSINVL